MSFALQEGDEKTSNQVAANSLGESVMLPQPKFTDLLSHSSSADDENLGRTEDVIATESKSMLINKEGGKIEIGGCAISFPPGSFDDVVEVHAKAEIDSSKWPPKYICITAMLWVKSQRKLLSRGSVSMESWCMKNCSDSRKILVDVLHRKIGSSKWDVVASLPLNDLKTFHFDCTDFSPYILSIHENELPATDIVVEGRIYADREHNFSLIFFLQHDLNEKEVKETMAERDSKYLLNFNTLPVKFNDKITANLKCMVGTFRFPTEFKEDFIIDVDFMRLKKKAFFHSFLIGSAREPQYVPFECAVQKNEVLVDGPHFFNYKMLLVKSAPQNQDPEGIRVTAEFPAATGGIRDL